MVSTTYLDICSSLYSLSRISVIHYLLRHLQFTLQPIKDQWHPLLTETSAVHSTAYLGSVASTTYWDIWSSLYSLSRISDVHYLLRHLQFTLQPIKDQWHPLLTETSAVHSTAYLGSVASTTYWDIWSSLYSLSRISDVHYLLRHLQFTLQPI